ncbi:MAG: Fic family protein, partial [Bacteriovorax sp.]|nr:Fic family protein [Bacteriovorax sp.]
MKKEELNPKLQKEFKKDLECGIEKGLVPEYKNTWFVISPPPPKKIDFQLDLKALQAANKVLLKLTPLSEMSNLDKLLSYLFIKREALNSSRMEGTWSTMELLLTPSSSKIEEEKSDKESILSYANILINHMDSILLKKFKFDHKLIKNIHHEVMRKAPTYQSVPGKYREKTVASEYVFIGGRKVENSVFNPTPPHYVKESINKLLNWLTDENFILQSEASSGMPFLVRMVLCHSNFEAIHPFKDGNGRVGRILLSLHMMSEGHSPLFLSGFIEANKSEYIKALEESQKKLNHAPLVTFLSDAVVSSFEELKITKTALLDIQEKWNLRIKLRKGSAAEAILRKILEHPIFTANQAVEWLELSKPAVYRGIDQLVQAGIIRERTGSERFRLFAAEEVIEIISRDYD